MQTLVTGGCGFIGSHLVDLLLSNGHHVVVIDNFSNGRIENLKQAIQSPNSKSLRVIQVDITDYESILPHFRDIDWVFHLAGLADIVPSIQMPERYYQANVTGTFHVLQAARLQHVQRLVYAASSSCYGIPFSFPTPETSTIQPQYPYALTKYLGECIVLHWNLVYHLPVLSLRLFNVYGPRSRTSGSYGAVFGVFLAQKLAGKPFTVVGDGTQTRDFTYVSDVARAFLFAAESKLQGVSLNVGSGNTYSVNRLVELLSGEVVYIPKRPGEPNCTFADITQIRDRLGWIPQVTFEQGVQNVLDDIEDWCTAPVWTKEKIADATKEWFSFLGKEDTL